MDREGTARRAQQAPLELQLWVVALEEGLPRKLATFTPAPSFLTQFLPFFDQYARSHRLWSPDGRALVLSTLDGGRRRLVVVPVDGGPARTIAEGEMAFWSPR